MRIKALVKHCRPLRSPDLFGEAADSVARAWGQEPAESDMSLMARQLSAVCAPLAPSASLLNGVLARLARALAPQKQQWLGGDGPVTDPMPVARAPACV